MPLREAQTLNKEDVKLVSEISQEILATFDLERILNVSVNQIVDRLDLLGGILFLTEGEKLHARTIAGGSKAKEFIRLVEKPLSNLSIHLDSHAGNLVVDTVTNNKINFHYDLYPFTRGVLNQPLTTVAKKITHTRACVSLPLVMDEKTIGALFFSKAKREDFSQELPVLRLLSAHIAIAITNARLYSLLSKKAAALEKSISEIKELRRQEHDMLAILSHEIKTPLTTILGSLELLEEKAKQTFPVSDVNGEYFLHLINMALISTHKERELTEKLLSTTRAEAEGEDFHLEAVNLSELLDRAYQMYKPVGANKGLELSLSSPAEIIHVLAEPLALQEVMDNLLSNAIKYTVKGSVSIKLFVKDNRAVVRVKDTGIGIHADDVSDLGKKFFRGRRSLEQRKLKEIPGGTGLGLYVVSTYLEKMGSRLLLKTKVGVGTSFEFSLALA